jgi:hypothetical protein
LQYFCRLFRGQKWIGDGHVGHDMPQLLRIWGNNAGPIGN